MTMNAERTKVDVIHRSKSVPFWKKVSVYFSDFTSNTSLHGFKYIGDRERTNFERALWLVLVLTSIIVCICLLTNTYIKWVNTPIILVKEKQGRPISSIPFPAVTICPENKINTSAYNVTFVNPESDIAKEETDILLVLCDDIGGEIIAVNSNEIIDTKEFIYEVSPKGELFGNCKWGATDLLPCKEYFSKSFTEDGVCYTFNGLAGGEIFADDVIPFHDFWQHNFPTVDWSMQGGHRDPKNKDTYPRRLFSSGSSSGLSLFFATKNETLNYACRNLPDAFKVILHHPGEIPRAEKFTSIAMTSVMVEGGTDVSIALTPHVTTTSESLQNYAIKKRGCYYPNEKSLRYFKDYTQQKCEYECIQNATLTYCGCLTYYMPMVNETFICRSGDMYCIRAVKEQIASTNGEVYECNCLPACSSISYSAELSMYTYDIIRRFVAMGIDVSDVSDLRVSRVTIYFKESQYFVSERSELYSITEFISNCGGLFGLFIGFSIISLVEAFYFITVRVIIDCLQYGRERWYGSSKVIAAAGISLDEDIPISVLNKA